METKSYFSKTVGVGRAILMLKTRRVHTQSLTLEETALANGWSKEFLALHGSITDPTFVAPPELPWEWDAARKEFET